VSSTRVVSDGGGIRLRRWLRRRIGIRREEKESFAEVVKLLVEDVSFVSVKSFEFGEKGSSRGFLEVKERRRKRRYMNESVLQDLQEQP